MPMVITDVISYFLGIDVYKPGIFANQRDFKMWSGSANDITITAIISPQQKTN